MPVTRFQKSIAKLLASNRSPDSHLAGGAALHFEPQTLRYSMDLDYFHDTVERVASAFAQDEQTLLQHGYTLSLDIKQPGYLRAVVSMGHESTKIEWSHDTSWRFMPTMAHEDTGYQLHPIDLSINKVLALAGRDEARDFLDVIYIHQRILPLGALCWAAAGKDPGFSPLSLLELLKRRGKYRPEDFQKLLLVEPADVVANKTLWLQAIADAETFIDTRPPSEMGCLYYSADLRTFISPQVQSNYVLHFGKPGGVIPQII